MSVLVRKAEGVHRFEADIVAGPYGSQLKLDGVEVPGLVAFSISHSVDNLPTLEIRTHNGGKISGFVDAITWLGMAHVLMRGLEPVGIYSDESDAMAALEELHDPRARIVPAPFKVTR